ncbi:MAG: GntR family transcriptional regulator [Thermodesulfobacteriota bacterium]|nr:GntR family transcriptional regulator [Thermodesulfobacteriota bacterium]
MGETLHLEPGVPKYLQISNWLAEMIQKGRYGVNDKLPSESKLVELFRVNRNTVRQAISDLVAKGLVLKRNGVGSFVIGRAVQPVKYTLQNISSFTDDMLRMGVVPRTRLISKSVIEAPPDVGEKLMLGKERLVILTERLRLGNRIPLVIERSYLPHKEYKSILKMRLTGSLYHLLTKKFHVVLHRSIQTFRAIVLSGKDAELLGVPQRSPGIFLESVIYDAKNIPVEVLHAFHRGDKYIFEVESGRYRYDLKG